MKFTLQAKSKKSNARAGLIETAHGTIQTPVFMPVATKGSVRGVTWWDLERFQTEIVLANTYHLHIRPGEESIEKAGGLQRWSAFPKPFLTDSGGYQVFSFARRGQAKIDADGVNFKDDLAGDLHRIGPVESMNIQRRLGADIVMAFDHCPPATASEAELLQAVETTTRWGQICLEQPLASHQSMFLILQGGGDFALREKSLRELVALDSPGYALGGVSVGETREDVYKIVRAFAPELPENKPRYLMGVGTPKDLEVAMDAGIDMFDCILPTRIARHGSFFAADGSTKSVTQKSFSGDHDTALVPGCACPVCLRFSRAYLKHLFQRSELTVYYYLSLHNVYALLETARRKRASILAEQG